MEFKDFTAGNDDDGRRFDKIIRKFLPELSLSELYKLMRKGLIKLNKKKAAPEVKIQSGDVISVAGFLLEKTQTANKSMQTTNRPQTAPDKTDSHPHVQSLSAKNESNLEKSIIFQNEHLLILNKTYDINVHGKNSLAQIVEDYYKQNSNKTSLAFTPGPLHRLDRKTTGIIVFSWSIKGAQWFSENIKTHAIKKTYVAILQGTLTEPQNWSDEILKDGTTKNGFTTVKVISATKKNANARTDENASNPNAKSALTKVTPLKTGFYKGIPVTYAQIQIETGRQHQIRAQSSAHGFPLLGDTAYGGKTLHYKNRDFFLHACKLEFPSENPLNLPAFVECPHPAEFESFLAECRF
ncbi:MAG: RluA family pseudouridine synthase [Treponema sp.]|nr:RluA family pseudouridine synthase [Treponema sp.]